MNAPRTDVRSAAPFGTPEARARTPLLSADGARMVERLRDHADAPRFNHQTGDRLVQDDLAALDEYRQALEEGRGAGNAGAGAPPPAIRAAVASLLHRVPAFRARVPRGLDLERDWPAIPTTGRGDVAAEPWTFVPDDVPVDRLVVYRTAGTTGHPISIPHHPFGIACYEPLLEHALRRRGANPTFGAGEVACFLVGAQIFTYTYCTALSAWGGAGFAKLNLRQTEWPRAGAQGRYFEAMAPRLLTGDPLSFAEMARLELPARPMALVTTSTAMNPALERRLAARYGAAVVGWYSLVETGPIGYACAAGGGAYHVLPHDVYVEAVAPDGTPVAAGARGEIAVTGGRNAFFPLLRYRTGDWGRLAHDACPCGDPAPRILDLEGRTPVLYRSSDGTPVSTVDLSRLLREFPLLLHEFVQRSDRSCELVARAMPGGTAPDAAEIAAALRRVLGDLPLSVRFDPALGDRHEGKAVPYRSELQED